MPTFQSCPPKLSVPRPRASRPRTSKPRASRPRVRRSSAAAVAALASALVLAGCGSSAPSKSQYVAKANALCVSASAQTAPLIREVTAAAAALATKGASAATQMASALTQLHSLAAADLAKLQALKQPSGAHAEIERFLTPFASVVSALGQAASALQKGQAQQVLGMLEQVRPASEQAAAGARAYGLTKCETVLAALA